MKDGKYSKRRRGVSSKALVLTLVVMLIVGCTVGGTLAWLTDKTAEVKNTFSTSDVDIELKETTGNSYKMVPGNTISKDPKVTVVANSEKAYVFVKVEKSQNFDTYMEYTMADGWTALEEGSNIYYRVVDASTANQDFDVIKNNTVTVKGDVTKTQMDALTTETYPTLTVTAYACQYMKNNNENFTATEAWGHVNTVAETPAE